MYFVYNVCKLCRDFHFLSVSHVFVCSPLRPQQQQKKTVDVEVRTDLSLIIFTVTPEQLTFKLKLNLTC